jgi:hypothetical protein
MPNQVRVGVGVTGAKGAAGELDRFRDKFEKMQKMGAKGFAIGAGAAVTAKGLSLLDSALSGTLDILGDATQAALEEETSIQKLGTSLRANVKDWNGNTAAIEKTLKARMALGFSDDEQRDSLAKIVVATKDVTTALSIQRTAMDLARLKGISLADASNALIKVEGGQFRALKALGIELKAGATATEALAAVTKAAAGQAEDFARTNEGKLLVSQVKVGEQMERLGAYTLPLVVSGTEAAADAVVGLATVMDLLGGKADKSADGIHEAEEGLVDFLHAVGVLVPAFGALGSVAEDNMTDVSRDVEGMRSSSTSDLGLVEIALADVGDAAGDMAKDIKMSANVGQDTFEEMVDKMTSAAQDAIDDVFDPMIAAQELQAKNAEVTAARRVIASAKASAAEKRDARETLLSAGKDQAELLVTLAEAGQQGSKAYKDGMASLRDFIAKASGPTKAALQAILDRILAIERAGKVIPINFKVTGTGGIPANLRSGQQREHFAEGGVVPGPVGAPVEAIVHGGEEVLTPAQRRAGGSAMGHLTIDVNVAGGIMTPAVAASLAAQIGPAIKDYLHRSGHI